MRTYFLDEDVSNKLALDNVAEIEKNISSKEDYIISFIKMLDNQNLKQIFNNTFLSSNLPLLGLIIKQKKFNAVEQILCEKVLNFMVNNEVQKFVYDNNLNVNKTLLKSKLFFKIKSKSKHHKVFCFFIEANNDFGNIIGLHDLGIEPKGFAINLMQSYSEEINPLESLRKRRIFL
jgi:hypothetical protein